MFPTAAIHYYYVYSKHRVLSFKMWQSEPLVSVLGMKGSKVKLAEQFFYLGRLLN